MSDSEIILSAIIVALYLGVVVVAAIMEARTRGVHRTQ